MAIIVSGPVIVEHGKVLLNKHGDDKFWKFPGGTVKQGESFEECAIREAKEEMGIDVELIKPVKPMIVWRNNEPVILIHFLAKRESEIKPAPNINDWKWISVNDILSNKVADLGENIKPVLAELQSSAD